MIKSFVDAWNKNKDKLEEYIRTHNQIEYDSYGKLVKLLFDIIINPEVNTYRFYSYDTDAIYEIDDGSYGGTAIYILHFDYYEPDIDNYVFTYVQYGSCSGCDTLQGIHQYDEGLPSEQQVEDYMELFLHLLQRCKYFVDSEKYEGEL